LLAHPEAHRPFGGDLFARIGGRAAVDALIEGLYDRIESDASLRPLFGRDLSGERDAQQRFFNEWLGGEAAYSDRAHHTLQQRHDLLPLTPALVGKWLAHFKAALDAAVADADARRELFDAVRTLAKALVNEGELPSALRARPHGTCGGARALRDAATREDVASVAVLLEHGADPRELGAGRWVLHPDLSPMLTRAGAHVDRSGTWIGLACTGNQGRKDDPEYVAALLRHGARANDQRLTGQGSDGGRASALHYASKAGFLKTISVLLEHGADPTARDDNGLTPLDWLQRAAKSVDRDAVRRLLKAPR